MTTATCAACGDVKKLCDSGRLNGLKQPRLCKDCLLEQLKTGKGKVNDMFWIAQMGQLNDTESIAIVRKDLGITEGGGWLNDQG